MRHTPGPMSCYHVHFAAHSGITWEQDGGDELAEARAIAAQIIRAARSDGQRVDKLRRHEWELCEPDDCALIPDTAGILWIYADQFECRECGQVYLTHEQRDECCSGDWWPPCEGIEPCAR